MLLTDLGEGVADVCRTPPTGNGMKVGVTREGRAFRYRSGVGVPVSRECLYVGGSRFGRRIRRRVDGCPPPSYIIRLTHAMPFTLDGSKE